MSLLIPSIPTLQQEIVNAFHLLQDDPQLALDYLIDLGKSLPPFAETAKKETHLVAGCLARVWLTHTYEGGILYLQGASEAMVTQGLLALLFHLFSGQRPADILRADTSFLTKMNLPQLLGRQRRAGLGSMVHAIRSHAKHYV